MEKLSYLTKRLKQDIKNGGMVIAPRRSGKTQAILALLEESEEYCLICYSYESYKATKNELIDRHIDRKRVEASVTYAGRKYPLGKKLIIDEFFWNSASSTKSYHCAVSSNFGDLVVYTGKGERFKIKDGALWNPKRK